MHRDMRRVGDEMAARVENGAGEIEPLLDVDRARGVLQRIAHLLGDRGEEIVEYFEHHGVGTLAHARLCPFCDAGQKEVIARGDFGLPFGLDHHGLMILDDQGRSFDAMARREIGAEKDRRLVPAAAGEDLGDDMG